MAHRELFELSVYGGAAERRYRRGRDLDALPWGTLPCGELGEAERVAARREWTDAALQEYASAATFSLTLRALLRARVPIDLSAMVARFPLDEIVHGELCARMAGELGGGTPLAYDRAQVFPLPKAATEEASPLLVAAERVVYEMCVRETWSHAIIKALHRGNRQPLSKAVWGQILDDESAHAGFGWLFLEWAELSDADRRRLSRVARAAIARLAGSLDRVERAPHERFSRLGIIESIGRARYLAEARRAIDQRVKKPLARFGIDAA